jgi:hypothetical protein
MKIQIPIIKTLIHAAVLLIATAVPSTARAEDIMVFGDFNDDDLEDIAALTSPTTITVGLANLDGSDIVSATLVVPKNRTITYADVGDFNGDGVLDLYATSPASGGTWYNFTWLGNGDGTFGDATTTKWSWPKGRRGFF